MIEVVTHNPLDLFRAFAATTYGVTLASEVRFARYNLEHTSDQKWQQLLGVDVNNLLHMQYTYGLATDFIRKSNIIEPDTFSPEESLLLRIGAITHDEGESILTDISYSDKTEDHAVTEREIFYAHTDEFHPKVDPALQRLAVTAIDEVIFNHSSKLGRAFEGIECLGYLKVALRAARLTQDESLTPKLRSGLRWLVADVTSNAIPQKLARHSAAFPAFKVYARAIENQLLGFEDIVGVGDFDNYSTRTEAQSRSTAFHQNIADLQLVVSRRAERCA